MKRFGLLLFGVLLMVDCGGGGGGNGPPVITAVVISGDSTVALAGTRQLTATALAGGSPLTSGVTFQWTSSDGTIAAVGPTTGLVSGSQRGTVTITAQAVLNGTATGVSAAHGMRVRIGSISLTPPAPQFPSLGDSVLVTAEARDALNAAVPGITFTWQSRATSVATATARANTAQADVVAIGNGTARIVVTGDGVSDSVTATVRQVATSLALAPDTVTFGRIDSVLTPVITASDARGNPVGAAALTWSSLNTAVATVDPATGAITSKNEPSTRVIATSGALADTVRVGVALVYGSVQIVAGTPAAALTEALIKQLNGSLQLGAQVRDIGGTLVPTPQVSWSLKDAVVATISASGLITGNANTGSDSVFVTARTVKDTVRLTVRQDVATVVLSPENPAALNFVGDTQRFSAVARDAGASNIPGATFTWSTGNALLGIDATGLAHADAATSATGVTVAVRATTDTVTRSVNIVVRQVAASTDPVQVSVASLTAFGRTSTATCTVKDSAAVVIPGHSCNWDALTAGVVTINPVTGASTTLTATGNGSTTIRATPAVSLPPPPGFNSITVDQVAASVSLLPVNFGTPDVQMISNQSAPFYAVVRDSTNNIDPRPRTDVTWSIAPGTAGSVAASTSGTTTVTTNAATGSETVQATIGALSGSRVVSVVATGVRFGGAGGVQSVFTGSCTSCHTGGASAPEGLDLTGSVAYGNIFDVAASEAPALKRVRPFRPDSSYLVHKIQGTQTSVGGSGVRMPFGCSGTSCLPNATINLIRNWILQGALNN